MHFEEVLNFWFNEIDKGLWFNSNNELDELIKKKFGYIHEVCALNPQMTWCEFPRGILAKIIVLDQFSRMIFRNNEESFYNDDACVLLSLYCIENKYDKNFTEEEKIFCYMPLMHSEDINHQEKSIEMFKKIGGLSYDYAIEHYEIIKHFKRFPHRNIMLHRQSTYEEIEFLKTHKGF